MRQDPLKGAVITDLGVVLAESQEASLSALRIFDRHPGLGLELLTDPLEGVVLKDGAARAVARKCRLMVLGVGQ